jgi:hypothetical protein
MNTSPIFAGVSVVTAWLSGYFAHVYFKSADGSASRQVASHELKAYGDSLRADKLKRVDVPGM